MYLYKYLIFFKIVLFNVVKGAIQERGRLTDYISQVPT